MELPAHRRRPWPSTRPIRSRAPAIGLPLPEGVVYLDGNSLGPPPRDVFDGSERCSRSEWGADLVRSWTSHGWIDLPEKVAGGACRL